MLLWSPGRLLLRPKRKRVKNNPSVARAGRAQKFKKPGKFVISEIRASVVARPASLAAQEGKVSKITLPWQGPAVPKNFKTENSPIFEFFDGLKSTHGWWVAGEFVISGIRAFLGRQAGFVLRPKRKNGQK